MTVESVNNRVNYITQSGDASFDFGFKYFVETDIEVYVDAVLQTSGYTLTPNPAGEDKGGTVTFAVPFAGGESLVIKRELPTTQDTDYVENDELPSDVVEDDFDRAAMRDQDQDETLGRCLKVGPASTIKDVIITDPDASSVGKGLIIDAGTGPDEYKIVYSDENIADVIAVAKQSAQEAEASATIATADADRAEVAAGNMFRRTNPVFQIVDGQYDYPLTYPVDTVGRNAAVFIEGVYQFDDPANYTFPDTHTIRFTSLPPAGSEVQVVTSLSEANPDLAQAIQDEIDLLDASIVRANETKTLTVGYTATSVAANNPPEFSDGSIQSVDTAGGAVVLDPPLQTGAMILTVTGSNALTFSASWDEKKIKGDDDYDPSIGDAAIFIFNDTGNAADAWAWIQNKDA